MERTEHNLKQGSQMWHAFRAEHYGASEASAMLGLSPYKTRTNLLSEKKTGLTQEVNATTQKVFDKGHEVEALARPIIEKIIGEDLSPVTFSFGKLSASSDGISYMGGIAWENKQFNSEHYEQVKNGKLPEIHWPQCQQVLYCTGAEKLFFTISDGTEDRTVGIWVYPDTELQQRIVEGWAQFERDLESFVPTVVIESPIPQPVLALPTLFIHAKGEITTSNMKEYGEALAKRLEDVRAIALVSDQDFSDAKEAAKLLRDNIKQANLAKEAMLSQTVTVGEAARMIDAWCEDMRLTALQLEKDVKEKDLLKKQEMIQAAQISFTNLTNVLEKDVAPIQLNFIMPNFAEAIKGKSKYSAMQDAISTLVANSTVDANRVAMDIRTKQAWIKENADGYQMLLADIQTIIHKPMDDLQLLVKSRILAHKESQAAREAKIIAEVNDKVLERARLDALNIEQAKSQAESVVTSGLGVSISSVNNDGSIQSRTIGVMHFLGVEPSVADLVNAIAKSFGADEMMAHKWLLEADFTKYKIAA